MNEISNNPGKLSVALEALKNVIDPEIGLNVVDLGLIYQIDFNDDDKKVFCTHSLTTQFCPMGETINQGVISALEQTFRGYTINTEITFNPPWNSQKISEEGKEFLNM